jgi:hypothetical protein
MPGVLKGRPAAGSGACPRCAAGRAAYRDASRLQARRAKRSVEFVSQSPEVIEVKRRQLAAIVVSVELGKGLRALYLVGVAGSWPQLAGFGEASGHVSQLDVQLLG